MLFPIVKASLIKIKYIQYIYMYYIHTCEGSNKNTYKNIYKFVKKYRAEMQTMEGSAHSNTSMYRIT